MALTVTPVAPALATTSYATLYTVPAATVGLVKEIVVKNGDSVARQVGINFVPSGGSASATNEIRNYASTNTIAAGDTEVWSMDTALAAGDFIQFKSDANSVVSVRVTVGQIT